MLHTRTHTHTHTCTPSRQRPTHRVYVFVCVCVCVCVCGVQLLKALPILRSLRSLTLSSGPHTPVTVTELQLISHVTQVTQLELDTLV